MVKSLIKSKLNKELIAVESAKSSKDKLLIEKKISLYRDIFKTIEGVSNVQDISETIEGEKSLYRNKIDKLVLELNGSVFCSDDDKIKRIESIKKVLDKLGVKPVKTFTGNISNIKEIKNLFDSNDIKSYAIEKLKIPDGSTLSNVKFSIEDFTQCELKAGNSKLNSSGMPASLQIGIDSKNVIYDMIYDCIINAHEVKKGNKITLPLGAFRVVNNEVVVKATAKAI